MNVSNRIMKSENIFTLHVCVVTRTHECVCRCARSPRISMEMNILPYLNRNVELLNIRQFRAEYYPMYYARFVCM